MHYEEIPQACVDYCIDASGDPLAIICSWRKVTLVQPDGQLEPGFEAHLVRAQGGTVKVTLSEAAAKFFL